jgi:hypothetical protein
MLQHTNFPVGVPAYSPFGPEHFDFSQPLPPIAMQPCPAPGAKPAKAALAAAPAVYLEFDTGMHESHGVTHDAMLAVVCPLRNPRVQYRVKGEEGDFTEWAPVYHQPVHQGEYSVEVRYLNRRGVPSRAASLAFTLLVV